MREKKFETFLYILQQCVFELPCLTEISLHMELEMWYLVHHFAKHKMKIDFSLYILILLLIQPNFGAFMIGRISMNPILELEQ